MHIRSNNFRLQLAALLLSISGLLPVTSHAKLNVFACEPEWAALAKELGGDKLDIYSATTAMQDPHHVQARPSLIAKTRKADLIVCSGAELEVGWLPLLLRKAGNSKVLSSDGQFFSADYVEKLEIPVKLDRSQGDVHAEGNPHVHTSPVNILRVAENLSNRLAQLDDENAGYYRQQYSVFEDQWQVAMQHWENQRTRLKGTKVISYHKYWSYLNEWLGLNLVATLEPLPGVSPSSSYLAGLIEISKEDKVQFIMYVGYVNERPAEWLSDRTGLGVIELPASVDYQSGESLEQWFNRVIDKLVSALDNAAGTSGSIK